MQDATHSELRRKVETTLAALKRPADARRLDRARSLIKELQDAREFGSLSKVAEAVLRQAPKDANTRRRYAQSLIELGYATAAIDVLDPIRNDRAEWAEAYGLIGRANKQIFFDASGQGAVAERAFKAAIEAYRTPFEKSPRQYYWHGVNLIAMVTAAKRIGLKVPAGFKPDALAKAVLAALDQVPAKERDIWYHASVAEANLAFRAWDEVERHLKAYVNDSTIRAFALGSTLRQFKEVWGIDADHERGRPLVDILRAKAMSMPDGGIELSPADIRRLAQASPPQGQPEAILGDDGPQTYQWMQTSMTRARSVGAIRKKSDGRRHGTCFLVKAGSLGLPGGELVVLTNYHVVNPEGGGLGIRPEAAQVQFEVVGTPRLEVGGVLWSSPENMLDAAVLRLAATPEGISPLEATDKLPVLTEPQGVYIIGHAGGDELAFSFQDNKLLDHEGPPDGKPPVPGRVRLHYRAPTKEGNSGSPVFNADWEVIGLHHYGGKAGVGRLNGKEGIYAANEGIWIRSIAGAPK